MTIKKYLHSCILIEENGPPTSRLRRASKRLLIDPGTFSFIEKKLTPEDIGGVDVILFTHSHADHFYPEALKTLLKIKPAMIITNQEVGDVLEKEGIPYTLIKDGEAKEIEGFSIQAFRAPHAALPEKVPENLAFLINKKVFHPGDSYARKMKCKVLALPTMAPWATRVDTFQYIDAVKPEVIIPIHDAHVKDFMLDRTYQSNFRPFCEKLGIVFRPLAVREELDTSN